MSAATFVQLLRGPFNFLRPTSEELRTLFPETEKILPAPQAIFLEDESATPLNGFPVLLSDGVEALKRALFEYVEIEEQVQISVFQRRSFDWKSYEAAWDSYRGLLSRAVENATMSSYGRQYPAIFWLFHSADVARRLKDTPKRILRADLEIGRRHGDQIKYRVFEKLLDRVLTTTYDTVHRLATDAEEGEEALFPTLLRRMADNVLILSEDHIGPDLAELGAYFGSHLGIDGKDLRQRLDRLEEWHAQEIADDPELASLAVHVLSASADAEPRTLLHRPGYVTYLSSRRRFHPGKLLSPDQVRVWESLLIKLKEFEVLSSLRSLVLPVRYDQGVPVFRAGGLDRTWIGRRHIRLSSATRPLDFLAPWVTDPLVHRYGTIYDITDFSEIVSVLHRSGSEAQDQGFRMMFRFQRRVDRLAAAHRIQLEKYLGDGAFYTSRHPRRILACALRIQRSYRRAVDEGFPFDKGLRIGLNFAHYRLIPIQTGVGGGPDRYEFFGQGVVELSRLTTGKGMREVEEIKTMLVSQGYPRETVMRFFSPLDEADLDVVDRREESRPFYAYINPNGTLVNEGIVATGSFIAQLDLELGEGFRMFQAELDDHAYVVLPLAEGGERLYVGLRKLGAARLKGLDTLPVYEVLDGADLDERDLEEIPGAGLLQALERIFAEERSRRRAELDSTRGAQAGRKG